MLNTEELQRLAEEVLANRRISVSTYCAECGYDLRTLPYEYRCPECGNEYNARAVKMVGILVPGHSHFPFGDFFSALFALAVGAAFGIPAVVRVTPPAPATTPPVVTQTPNYGPFLIDEWRLAMAGVLVVFACIFLRRAIRQTARFIHDSAILRKVVATQREE